MTRILSRLALALILTGGLACQALPWVHPTPTPVSYAQQMGDTLDEMHDWMRGVMQCFAPLRLLGLDRETARDCRPKELHQDGQRIQRRLKGTSPPAEVKGAHDRLITGLEELLKIIEERYGRSGTTAEQQFQAIAALERITKALQAIGDSIGQAKGE